MLTKFENVGINNAMELKEPLSNTMLRTYQISGKGKEKKSRQYQPTGIPCGKRN